MNYCNSALLPIVLSAIVGCTTDIQKPSPHDTLVGCWSGEDFQPLSQRKETWFMNRRSDGTFAIEFSTTERGAVLPIQTEEGKWNHKDGTYTTQTLKIAGNPVDTKDPQYTDIYQVKSVSEGVLTYYHSKLNLTFTSKRVACERSAV